MKYLLPILLLVLGCEDENFDPTEEYGCTLISDDGTQVWGNDCETGDECGGSDCPVPGGLGVLVCAYDEAADINVCSCSCDLDN